MVKLDINVDNVIGSTGINAKKLTIDALKLRMKYCHGMTKTGKLIHSTKPISALKIKIKRDDMTFLTRPIPFLL